MSRIITWCTGMVEPGTGVGQTSPLDWSRASAAISLSWIHRHRSRPGPGVGPTYFCRSPSRKYLVQPVRMHAMSPEETRTPCRSCAASTSAVVIS